jgi:hypothetical protein
MKTTNALMAMILAASFGAVSLSAGAAEPSKEAVAKACKGKKAGEMVKVDGKDVKCPEPAKK